MDEYQDTMFSWTHESIPPEPIPTESHHEWDMLYHEEGPIIEMQPEAKAFERTTLTKFPFLIHHQIEDMNMRDVHQRLLLFTRTPTEQMMISLYVLYQRYKGQAYLKLSNADLDFLFQKVPFIPHVGRKHPLSLLYGYVISHAGHQIDETLWASLKNKVIPFINQREEVQVTNEDILRYIRLWIHILRPASS